MWPESLTLNGPRSGAWKGSEDDDDTGDNGGEVDRTGGGGRVAGLEAWRKSPTGVGVGRETVAEVVRLSPSGQSAPSLRMSPLPDGEILTNSATIPHYLIFRYFTRCG